MRRATMVVGVLALLPLAPVPAAAAPPVIDPEVDIPAPPEPELPAAVPEKERDEALGPQWDTSGDRAWITSGDAEGLHVLTAEAATGYEWQEVASLAETGFATDMWIGNACLTGSGQRLAVTYAPRSFTNEEALFDRGGFTALVDLGTGAVTKLDLLSSLAYYSPGCGAGEEVLFTQEGGELGRTRIVSVDAATAAVRAPIEVPGQLTSAVPTPAGIVAADDGALVRVAADGGRTALVQTQGTAFELAPDREGGVVFLEPDGEEAEVNRLRPDQAAAAPAGRLPEPATLGSGDLTEVGVSRAAAGQVFLTGEFAAAGRLPASVHDADVAKDAEMSVRGQAAVNRTRHLPEGGPGTPTPEDDPTELTEDVAVEVESLATGETSEVVARPMLTAAAAAPSPTLAATALAGSPTDPVEAERTCAVPLNDPRNQVVQPKPRQVEWAVDQAVRGVLTIQRPDNWKNYRMPAYTPQGLFPSLQLAGGGNVPAQVMLGILAQESNLWQAPGYVVPGVSGNPLVGNYYGLQIYNDDKGDDFTIDWSDADCGYGVAQVTDGMRLAGREAGRPAALPYETQRAVALDYAANVAAGLRILQEKWNQTYTAGLRVNNADPSKIENWFYAIWAYNSGFHPQSAAAQNGGAWGVGWLNNPANPKYPANRAPFLETSYDDARNPQMWPYPEKVIGWAGHPITLMESPGVQVAGFRAAWWNGNSVTGPENRKRAQPPVYLFCDASNSCTEGQRYTPSAPDVVGEPAGPCGHKDGAGRYDLKCWYNKAATWKADCSYSCGNELLRFDPGYAEQTDGTAYPANCSARKSAQNANGLPADALVVDDVSVGIPSVRPCTRVPTVGSFSLQFGDDATGNFPSKTDFHQLGAGFNGHFWFAHTRDDDVRGGSMEVTGTWSLDRRLDQWARVMVHMPDHGAHTQQAWYDVDLGNGVSKHRVVLQRTNANKWVDLGVFRFSGVPKVQLSSVTRNGDLDSTNPDALPEGYRAKNEDIAFDAVAFQPLAAKPANIVVALGDSYSSGESATAAGGADYYPETDSYGDDPRYQNACHRSTHAWSRQASFRGSFATIGQLADSWDPSLDYNLLACSGAQTENLLPWITPGAFRDRPENSWGQSGLDRQYGELSQLDRGFLDENTTLVTLSIGGNDARFSTVIQQCILDPRPPLVRPCQELGLAEDPDDHDAVDGENAEQELARLISTKVEESVVSVLLEIRAQAPNAKIVLMGYPPLFEDNGNCVLGITDEEAQFLNATAGLLGEHLRQAVARVNPPSGPPVVRYSDPSNDFAGQAVCGSPETINGIILARTPGEESSPLPSQQSFHPKIPGHLRYANSLIDTLYEFGM